MKNERPTPPSWVVPLGDYLAYLRASHKPISTAKLYSYQLRRFAGETGLEPFAVTLGDLVEWVGEGTWGANTRRSVRTGLRSFYQWAHLTERMDHDPSLRLPVVNAPIGKPRPAPESAVDIGLTDVDPRIRLMIMLGAHAGLRCCEISKVHTRDLAQDLTGWSLYVIGKGNKERLVPLTDGLALALRRQDEGYVFPGRIDGHLSAGHVSKLISRALPDGVTAHPLRHRFAGRLYVGTGRDIRAVQDALGHASVATTQIYTPVDRDNMRQGLRNVA